jgi:hypothetical protein
VVGQELRRKKSARLYEEISNRRNHGFMCEFIIFRRETSLSENIGYSFENTGGILTILLNSFFFLFKLEYFQYNKEVIKYRSIFGAG